MNSSNLTQNSSVMPTAPHFRESLLAARQRLIAGRQEIKEQHAAGSGGIQISTRLTELLDAVVLFLFEAATADLWPQAVGSSTPQITLVAHGGYGRRDVAPYSDVDLMILYAPTAQKQAFALASRMLHDLFDAGLELGQSVRTPAEACTLAAEDAAVCTSLMESRRLAGNEDLYNAFIEKFQRQVRGRRRTLLKSIESARRRERQQFGETVYLLEPNIKRTRGGLRDLQLLRWLGFARYGSNDFDVLQQMGKISPADLRILREATEFLLRLRNELHFQSGKSNDVLDRSEQVRLAPLYGHQGTDGILPVEQFMRGYFRHTSAVQSVVSNFAATARPSRTWRGVWGTIFSHQIDRDYRITSKHIAATDRALAKLQIDPGEVLRLCDLANMHDKRIAASTWDAIRTAAVNFPNEPNAAITKQFLSLLSQPARLGELLRRLHELGVLEKILPDFTHARCLLQFNEYHKYTVDEHCILAVERATQFFSDPGIVGRVYRGIKQKRILHLALLIHDLGKGYVEDHSEVGLRIADDTAQRLGLPTREAETLKFLVHKHLVMSHLAFRRDTSDDQLVVRFAVDVGSPEVLDMLFVLTAADFASVGPGVWDNWKAEVVADLYSRTMQRLAGDAPAADSAERIEVRRAAVREHLVGEADAEWYERQVRAMPHAYVVNAAPDRIAAELRDLHSLSLGDVRASGRYLGESRTVEYVVGTHEQITPGVFHKLTGALASQGLQILSAEINTLADGLVLDRFYVSDPDFVEEPPQHRLGQVSHALVQALKSPSGASPAFRKVFRSAASRERAALTRLPTRVRIDNSTSDRLTIVDIFTSDRRGLLFTIARTLFEMELSISVAKIGTYLDQVVDVFYVTDPQGRKILDDDRLQQISARLHEAIGAMSDDD
jgi:[protein-PII] uridylyltransferase